MAENNLDLWYQRGCESMLLHSTDTFDDALARYSSRPNDAELAEFIRGGKEIIGARMLPKFRLGEVVAEAGIGVEIEQRDEGEEWEPCLRDQRENWKITKRYIRVRQRSE